MPDLLLFVIALLAIGIVIHAYNMGWQAGHDVHHEEPDRPEPPRSLYV